MRRLAIYCILLGKTLAFFFLAAMIAADSIWNSFGQPW